MSWQKYQPNLIYHLANEYKQHAYSLSKQIKSENDLRQYFTLIKQSINALQYVKNGYSLTPLQHFQITMDLVELLLKETHNIELAEQYLSSLKVRLESTTSGEFINEKFIIEYWLIFEIPLVRNEIHYFKLALKNISKLINNLGEESPIIWKYIFWYCKITICEKLNRCHQVRKYYKELLSQIDPNSEFYEFMICSYGNYCLTKCQPINEDIYFKFMNMESKNLSIQIWKLILQLLIKIFNDLNIHSDLNEFKDFFQRNKCTLTQNSTISEINIMDNIYIVLKTPKFTYQDLKNLLLLFQSVSYLTNCYDNKSNFSTRFLPKVLKTSKKLKESIAEKCSLSDLYYLKEFYDKLIELCNFYQTWESIILTGLEGIQDIQNLSINHKHLIEAIQYQISNKLNQALESYEVLSNDNDTEMKLFGLTHIYLIKLSKISNNSYTSSQTLSDIIIELNVIWKNIEETLDSSLLKDSQIWKCTKIIIWIIGRFNPFTENPMDNFNSKVYLQQLNLYFENNSLISLPSSEKDETYHLKKSLLLHFLLNYLSGTILLSSLTEKCNLSNSLFILSKQQYMPMISYISGLWNLMNFTLSMNGKEVIVTKNKLNLIVNDILKKYELVEN